MTFIIWMGKPIVGFCTRIRNVQDFFALEVFLVYGECVLHLDSIFFVRR